MELTHMVSQLMVRSCHLPAWAVLSAGDHPLSLPQWIGKPPVEMSLDLGPAVAEATCMVVQPQGIGAKMLLPRCV
eukprot:2831658-Karenia_brevis.AAC.1